MADGLLGLFEQGAENLMGALRSQNMGTLPAPKQSKQPDGIQWVPKFHGDNNGFDPRNPMAGMRSIGSGWQPAPMPASENTRTAQREAQSFVIYDDGQGRTMKVDPKTGKILWSRWTV